MNGAPGKNERHQAALCWASRPYLSNQRQASPPNHAFVPTLKACLLNLNPRVTQAPSSALADLSFSPPSFGAPENTSLPGKPTFFHVPALPSHCITHVSHTLCHGLDWGFRHVLSWSLTLGAPCLEILGGLSQDGWAQGSTSSKTVGPSLPGAFEAGWSWALKSE